MKWQIIIRWCKDFCTLQKITNLLFIFSLLIFLFILFLYPTNSTDLGWHLKYGEYFTQQGKILKANTLSYTMPDFVWTNDSWLYDVAVYQIFYHFNFSGLAITGALVGVILTLILCKLAKTNKQNFIIAFIPFYIIVHTVFYHGLRAQTVSLAFLAAIMCLVGKIDINEVNIKKIRFRSKIFSFTKLISSFTRDSNMVAVKNFNQKHVILWDQVLSSIPFFIFFLLWANWHGEYLVGLTYIGLVLVGKTLDEFLGKQKLIAYKTLLPILIIGFLVSLITPFGIANYLQGITHIFSSRLQGIGEWSPWPSNSWQWWTLLGYVAFLGWNIIQYKKLRTFINIVPLSLFILQAIMHRRMQAMMAVVSFPLLVSIISSYKLKFSLKPLTLFGLSLFLIWAAWRINIIHKPWIKTWNDYCLSQPSTLCSEEMINFLTQNQIKGKIFNYYNWGGYLIWRYPSEKVFIDGRMVSWQDYKSNYLPFAHYDQMMQADTKGVEEFFRQQFDYVLLPNHTLLGDTLLNKYGWRIIYQDKLSAVLVPFYH